MEMLFFFPLSFFKTTACSDQFFHSAAFSYQSSLIANMERLNQFSTLKNKEEKKIAQTVCVELSAIHALRSQQHGKK